jgi:soluble lytic murein transglycosylase
MTWEKIAAREYAPALAELNELSSIYHEISGARRLQYWKARCLEKLGRAGEATETGRPLTCADPPDLYARFASEWKLPCAGAEASEPAENSGEFVRVDELLRLRLYDEARDEAAALSDSRGKKLRQAAASFALGDFASSSALVKSAFPEMGTARESSVPEQWRRLYYPIDPDGAVESSAREFGLDRSLWLALVRQESAFNSRARSRAGAVGMTQLMPGTARRLSRKVLRKKFQNAFLYDPAVNVRLGASYLRSLLDEFDNDKLMAVASYNAGPGRIRGFLRDNPDLAADTRLESLPFPETRDYVRRVFLFAESYRELYPEEKSAAPAASSR